MPVDPHPQETRTDFMNRCCFETGRAEPGWNADAVAASCFSAWGRSRANKQAAWQNARTRAISTLRFDPNQPRDEYGRWTDAGGSGLAEGSDEGRPGAGAVHGEKSPRPFDRRSPTDVESSRDVVAVWTRGSHTFHELNADGAGRFSTAIQSAKHSNPYGASVHAYPTRAYEYMRTFVSPNGDYGFALKGDDIVSLFKNPNSDQPGVAGAAIDLAVQQGGRRADAFDTVLPDLYAKHGLRVVARLAWDDKEAPPGWDKKTYQKFNNGEPDVVFMVYDPASTTYTAGQGERVDEYDDGKATQDRELAAIDAAKPVPEPEPPPEPAERPRFGFGEADPKLEINRQISADYVLREGRRTDTEHLRWIDLATGELSPEIEEGTEKEVGFGPELGQALDDPSRAIEVDHNHPNSSPLSVQDLAILSTKPGCYGVRALGHDGSIYAASRPARHDIRGAFKKARGAQYTDADEFLVDEITSEKMEPDRGTKIFFHAVSDALGRNGWFDYGFRLAPDLQRDIDRLSKEYNALVADMQKRAGPPPTFAGRSIDIDWEKYPVPNAFIDPPGEYEPLDEWISYRKELDELSHLPGIEPFKQEADEIIERKRRQQK